MATAADWSIDIPDDLWKGLVYSVAIATWRDALKESRHLASKLHGFRPDRVPVAALGDGIIELTALLLVFLVVDSRTVIGLAESG